MLLKEYEDITKKGFNDFDVSQTLQRVPKEARDSDEFRFEDFAWGISFLVNDKKHSMISFPCDGVDKDGKRYTIPDYHIVSEEALNYWERRRVSAKNPRMQMRYSELVREYRHLYPSVKIDKNFYEQSIELLIYVIQEDYCKDACEILGLFQWLFHLTHTNQHFFPRVKRLMWKYMYAIDANVDRKDLLGDYIELVKKYIDKFDNDEKQTLENYANDYLDTLITAKTYWPIFDLVPHLMSYYKEKGDLNKVKELFDLLLNMANNQEEPAMRMQFMYVDLNKIASEYGLQEELEFIISRIQYWSKQTHNERHSITTSVSIKKEDIQKFVNSMIPDKIDIQLQTFIHRFVPSINQIYKLFDSSNDIISMMTCSYSDEEGHLISISDNDGEDKKLMRRMEQYVTLQAPFMDFCVEKMINSRTWTKESLLKHVTQCPVQMNDGYLSEIDNIFEHFFKEEYREFCYMIVPQVEYFVRHLLETENVTTITRREHANGFQLKQLDTLLRDPIMNAIYGRPITFYLRCLLTNIDGFNYRNRMCHGLIPPHQFNNKTTALLLLHAYLLLTSVCRKD